MKVIKKSAKEIVEFLYSGGDLTNEYFQNNSMLDGTKAHQYLQSKYQEDDKKEVFVKTSFQRDNFEFKITGRIDGLLLRDDLEIIEEIKSTKSDLNNIEIDTRPQHLMQAKMYAYLYLLEKDDKNISVRLTYINTNTYKTKEFDVAYDFSELEEFFFETIDEYIKWINIIYAHEQSKIDSLEELKFPFEGYRKGQRELMAASYKTIINKDILYAIAPTGIGKTISTIFSSLKTIKSDREKIFYLTAKNVGKEVALKTVRILEENGLVSKTIEITSKDKICFLEKRDCNPEVCKYAKGFFNRLTVATEDLFNNESIFDRNTIEKYAEKHTVCPFEYSLYVSYFSDIIICDYNYVFDPRAHLKRYFEGGPYKPILLVDEAHNLISRSRDMYSASISSYNIGKLIDILKDIKTYPKNELNTINEIFNEFDSLLDEVDFISYEKVDIDLINELKKLLNKLDKFFTDNSEFNNRTEAIDIYFEVYQFINIYEYYNESFVFIIERNFNHVIASIRCLDASSYLLETIKENSHGTIFFSATLFPLEYYQKLLTQGRGEYIHLLSPFEQDNLKLVVINDTSTRYRDRLYSIDKIISSIYTMINSKKGNYIVFLPSYEYLNQVSQTFMEYNEDFDILIQSRQMDENHREEFLNRFNNNDKTLIAFFVLGGLFSEGIDYIGDMLSGVLVVGVALPMINEYNNLLKVYFDEHLNKGFDYAYTYPGLNKIIQAVGRVIRTTNDKGIAILLDDRFTNKKYLSLYPREWNHLKVINDTDELSLELYEFWKSN